jgi:outer membrane translocation and assembly module TamA
MKVPCSRSLLLCLLLAAGLAAPATAATSDQQTSRADTNDVYRSSSPNPVLRLPQTLWRLFPVYPLSKFVIYAEHSRLQQRVFDWFTNQDHTFGLFPYVQLGGETGSGLGFTSFHNNLFGRGKLLNGSYIFAASQRQTATLSYRDPAVSGSALYWGIDGSYLRTDAADASVNGSLDEGRLARLKTEEADLVASLGWRSNAGPLEAFRAGLYIEGRAGLGRRDLELEQGDRALLAIGGLDQSINLFWGGLHLSYDNRDFKKPMSEISHPLNYVFPGRILTQHEDHYYSQRDLGYPEGGGLLSAGFDLATGSEETRFWRLEAEAQRFFTLFWTNRILALRARLDKVEALGDGIVPFSDLPVLGGSRLRGYKRASFRAEGALLLSAEYRWPVWDTWNAYLFWDEGHPFNKFGDIEGDGFRSSFGGGLSMRTESALLLGLRVAHSAREDALFGFTLEQEF